MGLDYFPQACRSNLYAAFLIVYLERFMLGGMFNVDGMLKWKVVSTFMFWTVLETFQRLPPSLSYL